MKCEKCGGEWIPPKNISVSLTNCPFCGAPVLDADTAKGYTDMGEFLQYLVSLYGIDLYNNQRKLNNLIADLYQGDERMKRVYRRAILDDSLSKRIYDLSKKPLDEREAYYNQIINQFSEANFYAVDFGKQVIESFVSGLQLEIMPPIFTEATEEDGEWIDEFGVKYSTDRKKLIEGNKSLATYKIREGTVVICDYAFSGCESLTSVTIPDSVTNIGEGAFIDCDNLTIILDRNNHFVIIDNVLYTSDIKKIVGCYSKGKRYIDIPDSVTSIGNKAFWGCKSLTNITIPDSVTSIGEDAFSDCSSLTSIVIPNSVTSIGEGAFSNCESLESIVIPNSVTSIGEGAFWGCESLTNITIPDSVTSIGNCAFYDCSSLTSIVIPNSVTSIGVNAFWGCDNLILKFESNQHFIVIDSILYTADKKKVQDCYSQEIKNVSIPDSVTSIGEWAFRGCKSLTSITMPDSVTSIGNFAFWGCSSLASITIPDSVTSIGEWAFGGCKSLTSITIPNSVTSIGNKAFWGCKSLTNITIPDSVTNIGNCAFERCESLINIFIPKNKTEKFKKLLPEKLRSLLKESSEVE